jgi:DNA ligase-4
MSINFNDICILLEGVEKISTQQPKEGKEVVIQKTRQYITQWFHKHRQALDSSDGGSFLSTIFPHRRKDRVYGLQPPALSKKLLQVLGFNHGNRMLFERWSTDSSRGDLGYHLAVASRSYDGTSRNKPLFPLERVDKLLTQLAAKYRFSDASIRKQRNSAFNTDAEFQRILQHLESSERKWFARLILREYATIELDETYIFKCYHFLLPDLLKFQNDFDVACRMLREEFSGYPSAPKPSLERSMRAEAAGRLKAVVGVKVSRPLFHKAWSFKHCLQMVQDRAWAAEVKYDGEYCEIHVNLDDTPNDIKIFSKNGKDATADRQLLHDSIRQALRIGQRRCLFKRSCIVLGEMVLYSDREKKILPFSKIRKHISRSGSFLGTLQDSLPHEWEHLMLVYFDVLMVDDRPVMHRGLQERRSVLRELMDVFPGRSQRSEWTLLDFKTEDGSTDLKQAFARTLAYKQEGLVLKPLHSPYLPLFSEVRNRTPGYFIKLKKDYLADMGGQRDLGDFAVIGARLDPQVAPKTDIKQLFWTHFYVGCLTNKLAVDRRDAKPTFKVVGCLSLDKCIPKPDLQYLNSHSQFRKVALHQNGSIDAFDIDHGLGYDGRMSVAFKKPFTAEILGGGYEKMQNETFEMLRHLRIKKLHHDRTWEDATTMEDLQQMAAEKWDIPDADELTGHAKDVALLAKKYARELGLSQTSASEYESTQETTQRSTPRTTQESEQQAPDEARITLQQSVPESPSDAVIPATQQETVPDTYTTTSSTQFSGSTQGIGVQASREVRILVRDDTSERSTTLAPQQALVQAVSMPTPSGTSPEETSSPTKKRKKRSFAEDIISPPKRRMGSRGSLETRPRSVLEVANGNKNLGTFDYDSQEGIIHLYAEEGIQVQVHTSPQKDDCPIL